jgi:peptide/nickel transport system permease protein
VANYAGRRLLALVPVLFLVSLIVFAVVRVAQGDPTALMVGQEGDRQLSERLRAELGFDRPIPLQYVDWLGHVLRGDLGRSLRLPYDVSHLIGDKLGITLELALVATLVSLLVGTPLGILAAVKRGTIHETAVAALSAVGTSMPNFWLGILLIFAFALGLRWLPSSGWASPLASPTDHLRLLVLPVITLAASNAAIFARVVHTSMTEALWQDYVRTGRAKGLPERRVLVQHALRNALMPLIAAVGVNVGRLLGGAAVAETIFGVPGLGRLLVDSIAGRDFPVVQGMVLYLTVVTMLCTLLTDLVSVYADPRVRYG